MQERKFIQLLKILSIEEEKVFSKSVKQTKPQLQKVYVYCRKYFPEFSDPKFTEKHCAQRTKVPLNRINSLLSELGKLLEDFLIKNELENKDKLLIRNYLLLDIYRKKKADKFYFDAAKDVEEFLENQEEKDLDFHYNKFKLNRELYRHPNKEEYWRNDIFASLIEHLDTFCIGSALKYQCLYSNVNHISPTSNTFILPNYIRNVQAEKNFYENNHLIQLYSRLLQLLDRESKDYKGVEVEEKELLDIEEYVLANIALLDKEEQNNVLIWAANCCIKRYFYYQDPENRFLKIIHSIDKAGLKKEVWIIQGIIDINQFNSIFTIAMMLKELEWAQKFTREYSGRLLETLRENTQNFCLARIAFTEKKYNEAISFLEPFDNLSFYDFINERILLLKCYYELHEIDGSCFDEIDLLVASFERYLDRGVQTKKITKTFAAPSKHFVKFIKLLFSAKNTKKELISLLNDTKNVTDRSWLMEKIEKNKH